MARTYNVPGQNLSFQIPEEGEVFTDPNRQGIFKWQGNGVVSLGLNYHDGAYHDAQGNRIDIGINKNALPEYNVGDLVSVVTKMGGRYSQQAPFVPTTDYTAFRPKPVSASGEVFTQGVSATNPHAATLTSSARGDISRPSPQYAQAGALPASAIYQPNENRNYYAQNVSARTLPAEISTPPGSGVDPTLAAFNQTMVNSPDVQTALESLLQQQEAKGLVLNPSKEITSADIAEFLRMAENEVNPGFRETLRIGREGYLRSVGYSTDQLLQTEQQLEQKYGRALKGIAEQSAESGFAQSGIRGTQERELAMDTQSQIDTARQQHSFVEGNRALDFASTYGSTNLPQQSIRQVPAVTPGELSFGKTDRQLPLYNVSPAILDDIIGSQEKERVTGIRDLAQFYESQKRKGETLTTYNPRSLTFGQ